MSAKNTAKQNAPAQASPAESMQGKPSEKKSEKPAMQESKESKSEKQDKKIVVEKQPDAQKKESKDSEKDVQYESTESIAVPEKLIDQIVGQERAVEVIKKAAKQKRNVLLVGPPGTGKSLLAQAMAELMPAEDLVDVLVAANPLDENQPRVKVVRGGMGRKLLENDRLKKKVGGNNFSLVIMVFIVIASFLLISFGPTQFGTTITAALIICLYLTGIGVMMASQLGRGRMVFEFDENKMIVDNFGKTKAPFIEATGAKAGSLLGDVRHDPLQSGGLGTPAHLRVESGFIHKSNKGVLFIDEVAAMSGRSQQELLTAMQEKKYSITGQSELSSGAMTRTEPVPCDFVLVAAGNYPDIRKMHPALRSRIRGYGYEVYIDEAIEDSAANRNKLVQFVAQEVRKDTKIPHFSKAAVDEVVTEAKKRSGRRGKLTLKLRELGGLIRSAGDIARGENAALVSLDHVMRAKKIALTLEQQVARQIIDSRKEYQIFEAQGSAIGRLNGLAIMGDSGIILPIVAEVAPASSREEGKIIATGKLGDIAKEAVENVSAIIKKHLGKDTTSFDVHVQFLQTYEGVEGDSASISVATAVISAFEDVPIDQSLAMTGSISIRGEVLPVGGITQKVEAAIDAGLKKVLIPATNEKDLVLSPQQFKSIQIIPVKNLHDVLSHALVGPKKNALLTLIKKEFG